MKSLKNELTQIAHIHQDKIALGLVTVVGWIRTARHTKNLSFVELTDGSSAKNIQVIVDNNNGENTTILKSFTVGASVKITGELVAVTGRGQKYEIQAKQFEVLGECDGLTYPLQKKATSFEYLREEQLHLRARTATFSSMFRIRSKVSKFIHDFFESEDFFYVHAPIFTASECEGGVIPFQVTTLNLNNIPKTKDGKVDYSNDFFGEPVLLSGSGQLQGELVALGLGRIYTFAPTMRAENSNTIRHLAEFWQVEPEMAYWNLFDTIKLGERLIRYVTKRFLSECEDDLNVIVKRNEIDPRSNLEFILNNDLVMVSYTEAVDILLKSGLTWEYPVAWGNDLKSEHERYLCEKHFKAPVAVYDYPCDLKSFYMYLNDDQKTVHGADILVPGVGEIIGSSQREHRLDVLIQRMQSKGMNIDNYKWFLDTRRFGTIPHSGFGIGLDRLLMWLTGMTNIRDTIPFPRTPKNCQC